MQSAWRPSEIPRRNEWHRDADKIEADKDNWFQLLVPGGCVGSAGWPPVDFFPFIRRCRESSPVTIISVTLEILFGPPALRRRAIATGSLRRGSQSVPTMIFILNHHVELMAIKKPRIGGMCQTSERPTKRGVGPGLLPPKARRLLGKKGRDACGAILGTHHVGD